MGRHTMLNDEIAPAAKDNGNQFALTLEDVQSALYRKLMRFLQSEQDELRARNDNPLDPIATAHLRGRLKEVSILQARLNPAPERLDSEN